MYKQAAKRKVASQSSTPSLYGSHATMVVEGKEGPEAGTVVLLDDVGEYWTYANRLDSGLADPRRYSNRDNTNE